MLKCCFDFSVAFKATLKGIHPCIYSPCQEEGVGVRTDSDKGEPPLWAIPPLSALTLNIRILNDPLSKPNTWQYQLPIRLALNEARESFPG